jgi:hypothetical protein
VVAATSVTTAATVGAVDDNKLCKQTTCRYGHKVILLNQWHPAKSPQKVMREFG